MTAPQLGHFPCLPACSGVAASLRPQVHLNLIFSAMMFAVNLFHCAVEDVPCLIRPSRLALPSQELHVLVSSPASS